MTTFHLYRVTLNTRTGLKLYAQPPEHEGRPFVWTREEKLAGTWMPGSALEVICSLRREHKPARLERCDETITD